MLQWNQADLSHEYRKLLRKIVPWRLYVLELKHLGWQDEAIYVWC